MPFWGGQHPHPRFGFQPLPGPAEDTQLLPLPLPLLLATSTVSHPIAIVNASFSPDSARRLVVTTALPLDLHSSQPESR